MTYFAGPEFWKLLESLPQEIQDLAHANYELLRENARHPSLHFKKTSGYWSMRIGIHYRALGTEIPGGILWAWIGFHAEYDRILG